MLPAVCLFVPLLLPLPVVAPDWLGTRPGYRLPPWGEYWDFHGRFRLTDNRGRPVEVILYAFDSDSVREKQVKRGEHPPRYRPNWLVLHAMYRSGPGGWQHKQLYSTTQTGFGKVRECAGQGVALELHP